MKTMTPRTNHRFRTLLTAVFGAVAMCLPASAATLTPKLDIKKLPEGMTIKDNILTVQSPDDKTTRWLNVPLQLPKQLREPLALSIECWATELGRSSAKYGGMKFMLPHKLDDGVMDYPGTPFPTAPFARKRVAFVVGTRTKQLNSPQLVLGLQATKGIVHYDLNTFKVENASDFYSPDAQTSNWKCVYTKRVTEMPQLRGVMLPPPRRIKPEDLEQLKQWGATLVRFQMCDGGTRETWLDPEKYDKWMDENLDILDKLLDWAKENQVKVCVDMHVVPGGRMPSSMDFKMFADKKYADAFLSVWKRIAERFKGRPEIYGYDLCNEPWQSGVAPYRTYWQIQKDAAEAIRSIDPETPIIIEGDMMTSPPAFAYLRPLRLANIIYQVHMYEPIDFTHLNATPFRKDFKPSHLRYPDTSAPNFKLNKQYLTQMLQTVRNFEKKHNAKIYVGEFSASMWANGSEQYIADCIDIFEKYGWDWTYHAFREWEGWSVEHSWDYDKQCFVPSSDNPRKQVLLKRLKPQQ